MNRTAYFLCCAMVACSVDHIGLVPAAPDSNDASMSDGNAPDGGLDAEVNDTGVDSDRSDAGDPDSGPMDTGVGDVGVDAGPVDAGCPVAVRCSEDGLSLETCRGGEFDSVSCPVRCEDLATTQCMDLEPSNGLSAFLDRGTSMNLHFRSVADYEDAGDEFNTNNCADLPGSQGLHRPSSGSIQVCVLAFDDVFIDGKITFVGDHGVAIVASGTITIEAGAMIRADGIGQLGGPGGGDGATRSRDARGLYPGPNGLHARDFDDAGGAGGGNGTPGETGGQGAEAAAPGPSGFAGASDLLDPIHGGSGGSGGGVGGAGGGAGMGGGAGGALIFVAREGIVLNGLIDISGSGGRAGLSSFTNYGAGGGGGSGGGLVLETAGEITVGPNARILASGGGGGGSADCVGNGTDGEAERPGNEPSGGLAAPGPCTFGAISSNGGDGAYDGAAAPGDNNDFYGSNGGGGGGGQGIVVIRADDAPAGPYGFSGLYRVDPVMLSPVL